MRLYGGSTAIGASDGAVSDPRALEQEWLGIAVPAGLSTAAFQARRRARLLPDEALGRV